jgi:hypothetical protein
MFSTMMIVSKDQGSLRGAPMSIDQFDTRLLTDIGYPERLVAVARPVERKTVNPIGRIASYFSASFQRPANA